MNKEQVSHIQRHFGFYICKQRRGKHASQQRLKNGRQYKEQPKRKAQAPAAVLTANTKDSSKTRTALAWGNDDMRHRNGGHDTRNHNQKRKQQRRQTSFEATREQRWARKVAHADTRIEYDKRVSNLPEEWQTQTKEGQIPKKSSTKNTSQDRPPSMCLHRDGETCECRVD